MQESMQVVDKLKKSGVHSFMDYGVEAKTTEKDYDETVKHLMAAIEYAEAEIAVPVVTSKVTGLIHLAILEKLKEDQTSELQLTETEAGHLARARKRLDDLAQTAQRTGVAIYFDAEESWLQDGIDKLVNELMAKYNQESAVIYNTIQLYRHDRLAYLEKCHENAAAAGYILGVKLVRGAYMEKENTRAIELGKPTPIQPNKEATDRDYDEALSFCVEHINRISICCASHNEDSNQYVCSLMSKKEIPSNHKHVYFSQLYGMGDHISFNLAKAGYNVAKYIPYGPIREVIPYLIRRAQENSSAEGSMSREYKLLTREMKRRTLA